MQLNQAYQLFQGLEQRITTSCLTEDRLYEFMHEHGQQMEDIKAHLGVLHNLFMEVNDHLNDLDTVTNTATYLKDITHMSRNS